MNSDNSTWQVLPSPKSFWWCFTNSMKMLAFLTTIILCSRKNKIPLAFHFYWNIFSFLTVSSLILMVPQSFPLQFRNAKLRAINFDSVCLFHFFFEWQLPLWSVICLSLDRISASQLCSLKWFKIAFEL